MTLGPVGTVAHALRSTTAARGRIAAFMSLGPRWDLHPVLGAGRDVRIELLGARAVVPERRRCRGLRLLDVRRRLLDHDLRRIVRRSPPPVRIGSTPPPPRADADDHMPVKVARMPGET